MILRAKQKLFRMAGEVKRDVLFRISGAVEASGSAAGCAMRRVNDLRGYYYLAQRG